MNIIATVKSLILLLISASALAHDLGVQGTVWEIVEQDIRVRMSEDAAKVNWHEINAKLVETTKENILRPHRWDVAQAVVDSVKLVDISQVLNEDFAVPKPMPGGEVENQTLFHRGYVLNPLDLIPSVSFSKKYVVISVESNAQLLWAKELNDKSPEKYIFYTTDGDLNELPENINFPIYPIDKWFFITAQVNKTPSIVGVSQKNKSFLTVAEFAAPFSVERAEEVFK